MKSEIFIGSIGVAIIIMLIFVYAGQYQDQTIDVTVLPAAQVNVNTSGAAPQTAENTVTLDAATVALHNSAADCWIIVNGSVYAVTNFLNSHPGGRGEIIPYCGKDATAAFATQGGRGQHSSVAAQQLALLRLGSLGSSVPSQNIN